MSTGREATHLPLTEALQLSLQAIRLVAETHDQGKVVGVLDAAHLICSTNGSLSIGGGGGNAIAPELKRGEMPDRLTDVYALGALMYRLLTGRKVDPSRLIEPPSHFNPAVDSALDHLVLCSLDEDPSERPYSARNLEEMLLGVYEELGLEDSRSEATTLIAKAKRRPVMKPVSDAAPKKKVVVAAAPPPRRPDPELTVDTDDDEDEWQPRLDKNPLERKWMFGGLAVLALVLIAFFAWPRASEPRETARVEDDAPPAKIADAPKPTVSAVQAKLVEPAKGPKEPKEPKAKLSKRRARR